MSGVAVVVYILKAYSPITSIVPAAQIMPGDAPLGTPKPLILVTEIDSNRPLRMIRSGGTTFRRERVQVSVLANGYSASVPGLGYPQVKALLRLSRKACENQRGAINGFTVDSITDEGEGPDLSDDAMKLYSQSTDFFVNWNDP